MGVSRTQNYHLWTVCILYGIYSDRLESMLWKSHPLPPQTMRKPFSPLLSKILFTRKNVEYFLFLVSWKLNPRSTRYTSCRLLHHLPSFPSTETLECWQCLLQRVEESDDPHLEDICRRLDTPEKLASDKSHLPKINIDVDDPLYRVRSNEWLFHT